MTEQMDGVALVTGGGRGIGLAVAKKLAHTGMQIVIADVEVHQAQQGLAELEGEGHLALSLDVSDEASVQAGFAKAEAELGPVRVLICNAGVLLMNHEGERPPLWQLELDNWEQTFSVNARGTFLCIREYLKQRRQQPVKQGRVITVSSVAAQLGGYRSSAAYVASKSAILGLTKIAARESAEYGITVNAIAPGIIDAPMFHQTVHGGISADVAQQIPMGRLGSGEDIAQAAAFLCSPNASYITGTVMDVNGGYRMQ